MNLMEIRPLIAIVLLSLIFVVFDEARHNNLKEKVTGRLGGNSLMVGNNVLEILAGEGGQIEEIIKIYYQILKSCGDAMCLTA